MKNILLVAGAIVILSVLAIAQNAAPSPIPNTIFVGADGKFETAPDTALIQFNISAQADNAKDAYDLAAKQAEATRQVMRASQRIRQEEDAAPEAVAAQPAGGIDP